LSSGNISEDHLIPAGETPFSSDPWFGRLLRPSQDFIGQDDFLTIEAAVAEIRATGKKVILNVGDSSTAGWDTRVTIENQARRKAGQPLLSAFFRYPTYSDLLRDEIGDRYVVLNAGIPGHTSINALRRLQYLLQQFASAGIRCDYVSIYIGNNDCQWENNVEDKSRLRSSLLLPVAIDRLRLKIERPDSSRIRLRTNLRDFQKNVRAMLRACRMHGALPIIIVPEVPLYWEPGKRFVAELFPVDATQSGGAMVIAALTRAHALWEAALPQPWSAAKQKSLEAACEMDFVVPRIKRRYRAALEAVACDMEVPLVRTSVPREQNDSAWFIDYCHPVGVANQAIKTELAKTVEAYTSGRLTTASARPRLMFSLLDSRFVEFLASRFKSTRRPAAEVESEHKDIYTLY
jgi:lysophospholipase L1-like esterase